jgi:multiple sugar transport system substrate-binding protein
MPLATTPETGGVSGESQNDSGSDDNVVITFAIDSFSSQTYQRLADEFHKENPNITVQLVVPPDDFSLWNNDNLRDLASTADTAIVYGRTSKFTENRNYFLDLSTFTESDPTFAQNDFWPHSLAACEDDAGDMLGLPIGLTMLGIFYAPAAFDAANLAYPQPGWTWEQFQQDMLTLASTAGGPPYLFVDSPDLSSSILASAIDYTLTDLDGQINAASLLQQIQWYVDLAKSGSIYPTQTQGVDISSEPPLLWVSVLNAENPQQAGSLAVDGFGFAPFPIGENDAQAHTTPLLPTCGVISSGSRAPRAAWAWLNYLTLHGANAVLAQADALPPAIPARISAADNAYWNHVSSANLAAAIRFGLEHGWFGSSYPQAFDAVGGALATTFSSSGSITFDAALADVTVAPTPTPDSQPVVVATPQPLTVVKEGMSGVRYLAPAGLPGGAEIYQKLVDKFQSTHPDVAVRVSFDFTWPGGDPLPTLTQNFDCFAWDEFKANNDISLLADLAPLLAQDDPPLSSDFYPGRLDAYTQNQAIYGLPASNKLMLMYYNQNLLDGKELQPPTRQWTFDEFLNLAEAASAAGQTYGTAETEDLLFAGRGVPWVDAFADPPTVSINTPETLAALASLADLVKTGVLLPTTLQNWTTIDQVIASGQVAFWMGLNQNGPTVDMPFSVGIAPIPQTPTGQGNGATWLSSYGQYISRQAESPQACWDWMKFLSAQPGAFPDIPARRSVVNAAEYAALVGANNAAVYDQAQADSVRSRYDAVLVPINRWKLDTLTAIYQGQDTTALLASAQQKAETYFDCLNLAALAPEERHSLSWDNINPCAQQADPAWQPVAAP